MKVKSVVLAILFALVVLFGAIVVNGYSSMDEGEWIAIDGVVAYQTRTGYEGMSLLGYGSSWFASPKPLLGEVDAFAKAGAYLLVRRSESGKYFFFDAGAKDFAAAQASMIGPLSRWQANQKLLRQYGDSTMSFHSIP